MKIAVAHFMHETVTFLQNETRLDDFIYEGSPLAGEVLLRSDEGRYIGGFVKVAREFDDVELIGISSPMVPKTYIGSGWITSEAYEHFLGQMLNELSALGPIDGVYLSLHGAMAIRGVLRPEADIARRIRQVVGPTTYIAGTFDPHGNEDESFLRSADLAFCAKYYPHYDEYLQGCRAARTLVRAIRGDYRPSHATCKVPILTPTVAQWTGAPPWSELVQRALVWEARCVDLYVNVFFGFPWGDATDAGLTIQALTNQDPLLARKAAADLAHAAWRMRQGLVSAAKVCKVREGVQKAKALAATAKVVIADHSDRSGAATWVLSEVIAQGLSHTLVGTVVDRTLAARLQHIDAQPGDTFDMEVGGRIEESAGPAIRIVGKILKIVRADAPPPYCGNSPWIVVEFGASNLLIVTPFLAQITEPGVLTDYVGLHLDHISTFVLKSRVHFRRGFVDSGFAQHVILVEPEQPFLGTTRLDALRYEHLKIEEYYPYGCDAFQPKVISGGHQGGGSTHA